MFYHFSAICSTRGAGFDLSSVREFLSFTKFTSLRVYRITVYRSRAFRATVHESTSPRVYLSMIHEYTSQSSCLGVHLGGGVLRGFWRCAFFCQCARTSGLGLRACLFANLRRYIYLILRVHFQPLRLYGSVRLADLTPEVT